MTSQNKSQSFLSTKMVTYYLILFFLFLNFPAGADDSLQQGISAYENGDFDQAIVKLNIAISKVEDADREYRLTNSRRALVTAYKYLALSLIGKGQTGKAEAAFQQAIKLSPSLKLNENEYSSKVISLFQKVRDEMVDTLTVVSTPTGATVFVDDQREGITAAVREAEGMSLQAQRSEQDTGSDSRNPASRGILKLDALIGKREIKVSKQYFEDKIVQVDIVKNGKNTVTIDLEPVRIGLWIKTEPSNVSLFASLSGYFVNHFIEDKFSGITPTIINTVMGAKLSLKLAKEGYRDKIVDIQLKESGMVQMGDAELPLINEMAHISITLDLLPPGQLEIASDPPNAEVYLDEELKGKTPLELNNVSAGKHRLRFHLKEFDDVTQSLEVISDKTVTVQCKLGGVLAVTSSPPGADVYLGETHLGKTPLVTGQIPQKPYYLKLSLQGYVDEIREVVPTSDITEIQVRLAKKTGSLTVDSNPPGAVIYLDGEKRGITPIGLYGLPIGKYDLKLTKAGYDEWSGQIQVEHQEVTWKHVYLKKK